MGQVGALGSPGIRENPPESGIFVPKTKGRPKKTTIRRMMVFQTSRGLSWLAGSPGADSHSFDGDGRLGSPGQPSRAAFRAMAAARARKRKWDDVRLPPKLDAAGEPVVDGYDADEVGDDDDLARELEEELDM